MLTLKNIKKWYETGDNRVDALKGVSVSFRDSEFVSVLGPSGCGKTTLLNIIGGLDRAESGELAINGASANGYTDADWDAYRNHSVGFVFQSYNLIPHQTVLANVELALTISGVSRAERKRRAAEVLKRVGLADQLKKKPNQLSGGQMQRVAIARALVNDPEILLADEPTGALDTETSEQVMAIMQEIARDRLVIMVTHNPDLAAKYSTRIINLLDGQITDDTNPFAEAAASPAKSEKRRTSMSLATAFSLSLNNLMTKKARTILTAFAGSIGIIGIALILSLSNGINKYISRVEEDTLSSYPIMIERQTVDMTGLLENMTGGGGEGEAIEDGVIRSNNIAGEMFNAMMSQVTTNDTAAFMEYIEGTPEFDSLASDIKYAYGVDMYIYGQNAAGEYVLVNPNTMFTSMGLSGELSALYTSSQTANMNIWKELIDNDELLTTQYEVVAGRMPASFDEVVIIVNKNYTVSDFTLYSLGLKDASELEGIFTSAMTGDTMPTETSEFTYDELLALRYRLVTNTAFYKRDGDSWVDMRGDADIMADVISGSTELKVVGILRPSEEAISAMPGGTVGYTHELTEHLISSVNASDIAAQQLASPDTDVFTGLPFAEAAGGAQLPDEYNQAQLDYYASLSEEEQAELLKSMGISTAASDATYEGNLTKLGIADTSVPFSISIYPTDFESKERINALIDEYNASRAAAGDSEIQYTDLVEIVMSSVNTIIDAISYVLIAFVAISLIVSSIMIGVITYISVLERTKEIGILRSIGASKRDIRRVFNAETLIVGFTAGALGIGVALLLTIPINILIHSLADISAVAQLPALGGVILVAISMALTWIAGLIPSGIASRRDPVIALRTE